MSWTYFKKEELRCPCCGSIDMDPQFMFKLNDARRIARIPFIVTSGFRCSSHNEKVGGVTDSSHLIGRAVDIKCGSSKDRYIILSALIEAGFTRIGIRKYFIYVDDDSTKIQERIWLY